MNRNQYEDHLRVVEEDEDLILSSLKGFEQGEKFAFNQIAEAISKIANEAPDPEYNTLHDLVEWLVANRKALLK